MKRTTLVVGLGLVLLALGSLSTQINAAPPDRSFVEFANVTRQAGLPAANTPTYGMAWGDIDNDGWVDLFIGHHAQRPLLMHNQQNGTFVDVTDSAGVGVLTDRHHCEWGDFNNDHWIDLYCSSGAEHGLGSKPNQLWQNNGDGTFQDVAAAMGVVDGPGRGRTVKWFDYNRDGLLDIFVGNQFARARDEPSRLFRNDGKHFTDVAAGVNLGERFPIVASALVDYNQDHAWDLAVAPGDNLSLFRYTETGVFGKQTPDKTGLQAPSVHALAAGDYDNDGYIDIFAAAMNGASKLFHNDHTGSFTDVTLRANLRLSGDLPASSAVWADWNNDGWLDLFLVRQGKNRFANAADVLWRNNGDGTFTDVTRFARVAGPSDGQGDAAAVADYDNDGFPDLFVTNGAGPAGKGLLYRNLGNRNHWLTIQLRGMRTNSLGIGSKVWITSGGQTQYREVVDGGAGMGQSEIGAHFGVGKSMLIQSVKIQWSDNRIQELTNVPVDQILVIQQP